MSRNVKSLVVIFALALSAVFGADRMLLPSSLLQVASDEAVVSATYQAGRGGTVRLHDRAGSTNAVPCGRVQVLCERVKDGPVKGVLIRRVRIGLFGDTWLLSAKIDGKELQDMGEIERRYAGVKAAQTAFSAALLLMTALLWRFLPVIETRRARREVSPVE